MIIGPSPPSLNPLSPRPGALPSCFPVFLPLMEPRICYFSGIRPFLSPFLSLKVTSPIQKFPLALPAEPESGSRSLEACGLAQVHQQVETPNPLP